MSKNFDNKKVVVEEIRAKFEKAQSVVVVDYRGLKVEEVNELRKNFRTAGVDYKIYKNNLVKLAVKGTHFESLTNDLTGPNAIAFGYEDPIVPAKIVADFAKTHKNLEFRAGVVEGNHCDAAGIKQIADIPSKEVLIAKLLGSFQAPLSNFVYLLSNIAEQKEA